MGVDRRDFLKLSAKSAAVLAGASPILAAIQRAGASSASLDAVAQGKRLAMIIDVPKCAAGKAAKCVEACHAWHNVPDWRLADGSVDAKNEVKWIWEEPFSHVFPAQSHAHAPGNVLQQPVLTLCNHCEKPPCVRVCPTQATFRREQDGIVGMDMHRCIGCRFCIAACPYGSRSFNWKDPRGAANLRKRINPNYPTRSKGVVEKCDFCVERLTHGLEPACVEAAQDDALMFGDLNDPKSKVAQILKKNWTIRRKPELGTGPQVYYIIQK